MLILTDTEKLLFVFIFSLVFLFLVLILFHFFRKYRKDKLLSDKYNNDYADLISEEELAEKAVRESMAGTYERLKQEEKRESQLKAPLSIPSPEANIKKLRQAAKDYSFFGWMKLVWNVTDLQVYSLCNAEGLMYLYFLKTTANLFLAFSVISLFIFLPLFVYNSDESNITSIGNSTIIDNYTTLTNVTINKTIVLVNMTELKEMVKKVLHKLTIKQSFNNSDTLVIVLVFSFIFTLLAFYHIYSYGKKLRMINQFNKLEDSLDSDVGQHTIHLRGLKKNLSYSEATKLLSDFFTSKYSEVMEVHVIASYDRNVELLNQKLYVETKYNQYLEQNKLSRLRNDSDKRPRIRTGEIYCLDNHFADAEIYFENMVKITNNLIGYYRKLNMDKNTGNAFISFKHPELVDKILKNQEEIFLFKDTFYGNILGIKNWMLAKATSPSDIIWDNIKYTKMFRNIAEEINPYILKMTQDISDSFIKNIIRDYYPSLIVVILNTGILPFAMFWIAIFERHYKRSYREKSIFVKSYVFLIINTFVIPTFGGFTITGIIKSFYFKKFISWWDYGLIDPFIDNAYFFSRYIIQVAFLSNSFQLLAFPQWLMRRIRVFLASTKYEKFNALLIKRYFDYGFQYSFSITVYTLVLTFSTSIPLIAPFGCLFFYFKYFIDKYNLLCVYPVEFESQGTIGEFVIYFVLFGIMLFQLLLIGLFLKIDLNNSILYSILYIMLIIALYYITRKYIFPRKENIISFIDGDDTVFNQIEIKRKSTLKDVAFFSLQNSQKRDSIEKREAHSEYKNKLYKLMKVAYLHPTERELISNPNLIYYDSYGFFKTAHKDEIKEDRLEYDQIIKKSEKRLERNILQDSLTEIYELKDRGMQELKAQLLEDFF